MRLALAAAAIAYAAVSYLMASGVTRATRRPLETTPASHGLEYEDVEFSPRTGGLTLRGWFIEGQRGKPTIIFVHGHNSNREEGLDIAPLLAARGFGILAFDLRSHGRSDGDSISGGYFERHDLLGAFDYLVKRGARPDRIGVLGFSMGAVAALLAAAEEPRIRAVVADSPYADALELIAQETAAVTIFPRWVVPIFVPGMALVARLLYGIRVGEIAPLKTVARVNYPILVVHGDSDERIPVDHGVRVHAASHPDSDLWLVEDSGHVCAVDECPDEYAARVATYFESRLGR